MAPLSHRNARLFENSRGFAADSRNVTAISRGHRSVSRDLLLISRGYHRISRGAGSISHSFPAESTHRVSQVHTTFLTPKCHLCFTPGDYGQY